MRNTIAGNCGDVVLVPFVFSDESCQKRRPALVVSAAAYHRARRETIVAAITSNVRRGPFGDHVVVQWKDSGLLFPSVVTGIIRTITRSMIERKLGPYRRLNCAQSTRSCGDRSRCDTPDRRPTVASRWRARGRSAVSRTSRLSLRSQGVSWERWPGRDVSGRASRACSRR